MTLLVSGGTRTLARYAGHRHVGRLLTPADRAGAESLRGWVWAMDNGAFSGFNADTFVETLHRVHHIPGCLWVACPDVVADAAATRRLFDRWARVVRSFHLRVAYVGQDGQGQVPVPWDQMDALFIGGSTAWKLSSEAATLAAYAKARGKWVHMGRVNSARRLRYALRIGCDSIDGTSLSWFGDTHLPRRLGTLAQWQQQPELRL